MKQTHQDLLKKYGKKFIDAQKAFHQSMEKRRIMMIHCKECKCTFSSPDRICPICHTENPVNRGEPFYPVRDVDQDLYNEAKKLYSAKGIKQAIEDHPSMKIDNLLKDMIKAIK